MDASPVSGACIDDEHPGSHPMWTSCPTRVVSPWLPRRVGGLASAALLQRDAVTLAAAISDFVMRNTQTDTHFCGQRPAAATRCSHTDYSRPGSPAPSPPRHCAASSVRDSSASLSRMCPTWLAAVFSLITSSRAMRRLLSPRAISAATSRSRGVNASGPRAPRWRAEVQPGESGTGRPGRCRCPSRSSPVVIASSSDLARASSGLPSRGFP